MLVSSTASAPPSALSQYPERCREFGSGGENTGHLVGNEHYPVRIDGDGIIVDDPDHPDDIQGRVREVLSFLWGERAPTIEGEGIQAVGTRDLGDYFRRSAGFFTHHLSQYSKSRRQAPIYWPLSTDSGSYTLWLYYHRLTVDTLDTAVNRYVLPKMDRIQRELDESSIRLEGTVGREAARLREEIERHRRSLSELGDLRDELLRVAALPYRPNLDDGVIINAAPLHKLFRHRNWARDTRAVWEKLERGDYDWTNLAYQIWPERVREKCRTDRSLAIAHGLKELYEAPAAEQKVQRGRRAKAAEHE